MIQTTHRYRRVGPASSTAIALLCVGLAAPLRPEVWGAAWFSTPRGALGTAVFAVLMLSCAAVLRLGEWAVERSPCGSAGTSTTVYGTLSVLFGLVPIGMAYIVFSHRDHLGGEGALGVAFIGMAVLLLSAAVCGGIALAFGFAAWCGRHPARWVGAVGLVLAVCDLTPLVSALSALVRSRLGG